MRPQHEDDSANNTTSSTGYVRRRACSGIIVATLLGGISVPQAAAAAEIHVLFIGNSYTVGLPRLVQQLARANGRSLICQGRVAGGWTLKRHAASPETMAALRSRRWDVVVLQEQSQIPSFPEQQRETDLYPLVHRLDREIRDAGARTALFLTWARRSGDPSNVHGDSFEKMQLRLNQGYRNAAQRCSAEIVPAGPMWAWARKVHPEIELFHRDGSHPAAAGHYLTACLFVRTLCRQKLDRGVETEVSGLSDTDEKRLREMVNGLPLKSESAQ